MSYLLLGTSACHLCSQAEELLEALSTAYHKVDIAEEEQWQARYAIKIPVLLNTTNQTELCWPFSQEELQLWLITSPLSPEK